MQLLSACIILHLYFCVITLMSTQWKLMPDSITSLQYVVNMTSIRDNVILLNLLKDHKATKLNSGISRQAFNVLRLFIIITSACSSLKSAYFESPKWIEIRCRFAALWVKTAAIFATERTLDKGSYTVFKNRRTSLIFFWQLEF